MVKKYELFFFNLWDTVDYGRNENGPGEYPEDGEMNEMTLSSRHRIRNSGPGGLRPSTLPLGHGGSPQYWVWHVDVDYGRHSVFLLEPA